MNGHRTMFIRYLRLLLAVASVGLVAGCAIGELSSSREIGLYSLGVSTDKHSEPVSRGPVPLPTRVPFLRHRQWRETRDRGPAPRRRRPLGIQRA